MKDRQNPTIRASSLGVVYFLEQVGKHTGTKKLRNPPEIKLQADKNSDQDNFHHIEKRLCD